ncbi:hypothetical protein FSP39_018628 [Pinctada imbricata]|uniref:BMP and activin membrane-bound inhibitor homolog n=1 Tax=Pinctada imbricata TaxID=66713 RepID=A0AA88YP74_PINIB|nr:hypothetical protein FSP39_018628 [Pinctada imbricata]
MCKSASDMCYVIKTFEGETPRHTHGCVDTLVSQGQNLCDSADSGLYKEGVSPKGQVISQDGPVVRCCKEDMCNYNIDVIIHVQSNASSNEKSADKNEKQNPAPPGTFIEYTKPEVKNGGHPEKDLWFKAAVIAVPIAGGFILILLVLLAVRMLRADSRRHRQFIQIRRERTSMTKAQLYVTDHFCEKVENSTTPFFGGKCNPVYKTEKDTKTSEKKKKSYPTILIFGKPPKKDLVASV